MDSIPSTTAILLSTPSVTQPSNKSRQKRKFLHRNQFQQLSNYNLLTSPASERLVA